MILRCIIARRVTRRIQFKFPRNNHGNAVSFTVGFHGRGGSYDDLVNDTEDDAPKWVRDITPAKATASAETSVFVDISAFVGGAGTIRSIGASNSLDAVLVIRAEHCQDAYIALTGAYAQNPILCCALRSLPPKRISTGCSVSHLYTDRLALCVWFDIEE